MDNDKNAGFEKTPAAEGEKQGERPAQSSAPRARNRTVMLTPEITGQVRARLAQDIGESGIAAPSGGGNDRASASDAGFVPVSSRSRAGFEGDSRKSSSSGFTAPPAPSRQGPAAPAGHVQHNPGVVWQKKTPVIGFLVSFDADTNGDVYELRTGRVIVTSEPSGTGNFFIVNDDTVSPMHAILRIAASGEVQVLDQLSEFGTKIKRFGSDEEIELSGEKGTLEHGDIVRFGKRNFNVCIIQKGSAE
jgi:hypothetical protein